MPTFDEAKLQRMTDKMLAPVLAEVEALRGSEQPEAALEAALAALAGAYRQMAESEYASVLRGLQRKSEKLDPRQLELLAELLREEDTREESAEEKEEKADEGTHDHEVEGLLEETEAKSGGSRSRGRRKLPEQLPRELREQDVAEHERTCPCCGSERREIGREVREVLDVVPVRFRVLRYERIRRACAACGESGVVTAPAPTDQLERVLASPRLLAHVTTSKYEAHLPLYRLRRLYRHMGLSIAESTLGGWVARVAEELRPLRRALWEELRAQHVVGTDASGLRVLDRDAPENVTLGTMWCYVGYPADLGTRLCVYRYAPTGTGRDGPWSHLAGQAGYVQADAANVFDRLFNGRVAHAVEVGCWAHARRKLHERLDSDPRVAPPLQRIARIYRAEKAAQAAGLSPEERLGLRLRVSKKHVDWLKRWLAKTSKRTPPRSALGKACAYWNNHWEALTRFLEDGSIELDNTEVERQIRALALGRKNYLFAGSHRAAERSAVLYSMLRTCDLAGIDATDWLEDVLVRLAAGWPQKRIGELLPHRWKTA